MPMKSPSHPGDIVRELCLEGAGLTVTQAAKGLGVTRPTLSKLLNGRSSVSPEMALRLSKAFGSTPGYWLRLQLNYDLARMEEDKPRIKVRRLIPSGSELAENYAG